MSFGILEKLDIKVVLLEIDLEIYPLLFNKNLSPIVIYQHHFFQQYD